MRHLGARLALALTLVMAGVMVGTPVVAQEVIEVSARDLMAHRLEVKSALVYPAIAKAARISGTVVVQLDVSAEGAVVSTKAISGHPMLQQAAIDFVKQLTFKPFEKDGVAVGARGQTSVIFTLGEPVVGSGTRTDAGTATQTPEVRAGGVPVDAAEEATAKTYFEQFTACSTAIRANKHDAETALICRHAADTAATFAPDRRFIEKRSADVYAATALANSGDLVGALRYADRAVDVVKLGHDDALSQRRIDHPLRAKLFIQSLGSLEDATLDTNILADDEHLLIAQHLFTQRLSNRADISHKCHR